MNGSKNYGTFTQWNSMSRKKEGAPTLCDSMDGTGESTKLSEINQAVRDKYHMISPLSAT